VSAFRTTVVSRYLRTYIDYIYVFFVHRTPTPPTKGVKKARREAVKLTNPFNGPKQHEHVAVPKTESGERGNRRGDPTSVDVSRGCRRAYILYIYTYNPLFRVFKTRPEPASDAGAGAVREAGRRRRRDDGGGDNDRRSQADADADLLLLQQQLLGEAGF
jgi:hypothetical protein